MRFSAKDSFRIQLKTAPQGGFQEGPNEAMAEFKDAGRPACTREKKQSTELVKGSKVELKEQAKNETVQQSEQGKREQRPSLPSTTGGRRVTSSQCVVSFGCGRVTRGSRSCLLIEAAVGDLQCEASEREADRSGPSMCKTKRKARGGCKTDRKSLSHAGAEQAS